MEWFGHASLGLTATAFGLLLFGIFRRLRSPAIHCPGPRPSILARLDPRRWVLRRACWYNLTGLPQLAAAAVRCPECGTISMPRRRLRDGRRWRPTVVAAALALSAIGVFATPWIMSGRWVAGVPDIVLVGFERLGRRWQPRDLRIELSNRIWARTLDDLSAAWLVPKLVADLRDDARHNNADRAAELIDALWPAPEKALQAAVRSDDRQQRMIAAWLLRQNSTAEPSVALLRACVEDLRDDADLNVSLWNGWNANEAVAYLTRHADPAAGLIEQALDSDDYQQHFLAACVAGTAPMPDLIDRAAPILIDNLRDDDIVGNAKLATPALYGFGPSALPFLHPHVDSQDAQLRGLARSMVERLQFPSRPQRLRHHKPPHITVLTDDPIRPPEAYGPGLIELFRAEARADGD